MIFPIIIRQRNISSRVPSLYKMWHWFHRDAASHFIVTCLSRRVFKLELRVGVCGPLALRSSSSQRMEAALGVSHFSWKLLSFLLFLHSSPKWMLSCFQPTHIVCSDLIHFNGEVKFSPGNFLWHHIPRNRICQFIWISSKGFTYIRVKWITL